MAQIDKPNLHFNTKLYTGNGGTQAVTGVGFQTDWCWIKNRGVAESHVLFDSVRGVQKAMNSNTSSAEATSSNYLTAFGTDGFTVGASGLVNDNSNTYASWNWKAGTTSGITQGGASITPSSYSFNATSGFSIIKWTGTNANATIPHGLGVAPKMIIIRRIDSTSDWAIYHHKIGNTKRMVLNSTAAESGASANWFNNTSPTANVFSVGTDGGSNGSTDNYIAYCFVEKKGYSKFGSYTGNGNADGAFVYTGFKPKLVIVKEYGSTGNWIMKNDYYDNQNDHYLLANSSDAETSGSVVAFDLLSNGFKLRGTAGDSNGNGASILYMAFAENPIVGSNNVPATAR
jgi:hypothetical protein